ncbi:peptide chain release factor N(5)-glutamine methyltransferase [Pseudanabaena biceps]|nr:peptide chain release factor N(5)-glutamine methyltransferase [Pseudanabaena biceps]
MNFWEWYDRSLLIANQSNVPKYELEWLILNLTSLTKLDLRLRSSNLDHKLTPQLVTKLDQLWQKRLIERVPVQYLTGSVIWRDLELNVSPDVLIPRPETELIIDIITEFVNQNQQTDFYKYGTWVDLGTGSGAIAIALAQQFPHAQIHAIDISENALEIAEINSYKNHQKINFHLGNWFEPLANLNLTNQITGIVSNPPYIPSLEVLNLQPEVVNHEPHLALDGGNSGLDSIRELVDVAPKYLVSGGFWIIELMSGQAEIVRSLLQENGKYTNIQIHQDYANIERFVSGQII